MSRANERLSAFLVAKHAPQLLDDTGDSRVGDKRVRPQTSMQLVFRHDSRRIFDEEGEQVERLARQVHTPTATADDASLCVQCESVKSHDAGSAHNRDYIS